MNQDEMINQLTIEFHIPIAVISMYVVVACENFDCLINKRSDTS